MGRPLGQLERSLAALTIGVAQGRERRARSLADAFTGEWEQQLRLDLSGQAAGGWGWGDRRVTFDIPFLYAPLQRTIPFETPQFTYGVEMTQTTDTLVLVHAHLLKWTINRQGWITGATLRFGVQAPAATAPMPFSATVHLTFQGFGTTAEQEEDD